MENEEREGFAPRVRIFLLGGFRVDRDGVPIAESAWSRRQAITLVKLLAVEPSHRLHREQVIDLFWPDAAPSAGSANLRKLLHYARQPLHGPTIGAGENHTARRESGAHGALLYVDDLIKLDPRSVWIDADDFEDAARHAVAGGAIDELDAAAALYTGELLPGNLYEPWAEQRREVLAALYLDVLLTLASALEAEGRTDEAAARLHQVLTADPAHEGAHRSLMLQYARQGNRRQALQQYRLCVQALDEHVGAPPSPETETVYRQIAEGTVDAAMGSRPKLPSAVRAGAATPFVGRERALDLIRGQWMAGGLRVERGTVVTVGGEAGVGKTRLAAEAARAATVRGAVVLWGSASGLEGRVAYGPLAEALEDYVAHLSRAEREELAADQPELGRMLPSLDIRGPMGDPQTEQMRLFAGVARLLSRIAANRPLLLVIDDLHLADDASLQLLRYLARLAADRRWRIIGTYREEGLEEETSLRHLIADLQHMGASLQVDLLPLARRDSDRLVEAMLAPHAPEADVLDYVFRLSLGNPLFVVELVESLRESGTLALRDGRWGMDGAASSQAELPRGARALIESRMRSLDEGLRAFVSCAAVTGMAFESDLLSAATDQDEDAVVTTLDRAVVARILEERDRGYAFRHPLFREVLYQGLSTRRRALLHAALGRALEVLGSTDVEALAHHFSRSTDRAKAAAYLERAADRARDAFANAIAVARYSELIDVLESDVPESIARPADLARACAKLGRLRLQLVQPDAALPVLERAVGLSRTLGDLEGLANAAAYIGEAHYQRAHFEDGLRHIDAIVWEVSAGKHTGQGLASLHHARALLLLGAGRHEDQLAAANQAVAATGEARTSEARRFLAAVHTNRGMALSYLGRLRASVQALESGLAVLPEGDDLNLEGNLHFILALAHLQRAEFREHLTHTLAARDAFLKFGFTPRVPYATSRLGIAHIALGDWDKGRETLERALHELDQLDLPLQQFVGTRYRHIVLLWRGILRLATSDMCEARADLEAARQARDAAVWAMADHFLAEADMLEGKPDLALARMQPLLNRSEELGVPRLFDSRTFGGAAWALAELGDPAEAERLSLLALERTPPREIDFLRMDALTHRALVLAAQDRRPEAERMFGEALQLCRDRQCELREVWVLRCWARVEVRHGNRDRAREVTDLLIAILKRHGATLAAVPD